MMKIEIFRKIEKAVIRSGYGNELVWAAVIRLCPDADTFAFEASWVIISSGIKNQVARKIELRFSAGLKKGQSALVTIGHKGKAQAIDYIITNRARLFREYQNADDKIAFLETLPWVGPTTKYHLAKNLGIDTCKPDRHLIRIAAKYNTDPFTLCKDLAIQTGKRIAYIDSALWRAANLGLI